MAIYLDNNATTPIDPDVFEAMRPFMSGFAGNPSSIHSFGQRAKGALTHSAKIVAGIFGVRTDELVFTSGATEALNLFIHNLPKNGHIITSSLEHSAIIEPLKFCRSQVSYLDPEKGEGAVTAQQIKSALKADTKMIIISAANNETGIKTDIEAISKLAVETEILLVVDGVAFLGKGPLKIPNGVSAMCFSGHKIHGPLGVGVAVIRKGVKISPMILGGSQQRGFRGGTENLPGIIGFCSALQLLEDRNDEYITFMSRLRDRFEKELLQSLPDILIHGINRPRLCNTSNIAFLGVDGETLLMSLDLVGIAASHGAACSIGSLASSRVLLSMGIPASISRSSLRFSFSRMNTVEEVDRSVALIVDTVNKLRLHK